MAIEIRELVIRASVTEPLNPRQKNRMDRADLEKMKRQIIEECLLRLDRRKERNER